MFKNYPILHNSENWSAPKNGMELSDLNEPMFAGDQYKNINIVLQIRLKYVQKNPMGQY
jgi:hypothetical protein